MRKFYLLSLFCVSFLLNLSGFATTFTVTVANNTFTPASIPNVIPGDTILWVWSAGNHTTTSTANIPSGAPSWDHVIAGSGQSFAYKVPNIGGTYNYKCSIHNGMTGSFTVTATPTSIASPIRNNIISFYPNPFVKNVLVDFRSYDLSNARNMSIEMYDILGNRFYQAKGDEIGKDAKLEISAENLKQGVYFLYIINNGKREIYRIVKSSATSMISYRDIFLG